MLSLLLSLSCWTFSNNSSVGVFFRTQRTLFLRPAHHTLSESNYIQSVVWNIRCDKKMKKKENRRLHNALVLDGRVRVTRRHVQVEPSLSERIVLSRISSEKVEMGSIDSIIDDWIKAAGDYGCPL